MKGIILCALGALALASILTVGTGPSSADTSKCWNMYNKAWDNMKRGDHKGYDKWMAKYNDCMRQNWSGPVPQKKKKHM